jgi:tryptophan halogenase
MVSKNLKKQRIVIVGGGTSGWITAAILAKGLSSAQYEIELIESKEIPTIGVGEATIPSIVLLLDYLEIDRFTFLSKVNGTCKYVSISMAGQKKIKHICMLLVR